MFDLTGIGAALASARSILELLKNANDAQLAMKISSEVANLQGQLIGVQQQALSLQTENQELRDEVRQLKQTAQEEQRFHFSDAIYWKKRYGTETEDSDAEGNPIISVEVLWDGPFCPLCKDNNGKVVHLKNGAGMRTGNNRVWECEIHDSFYQAPTSPSILK